MNPGQGSKSKFVLGVLLTILATALVLRGIDYYTKNGSVEINDKKFKVETVANPWDLERGLSGRKSLADGRGMLFVFSKEDYWEFWMKGMNFSIDILWINQGKVVDIKERTPIPTTNYVEGYRPEARAKYVLEIGAGLAEKYGIKVGDAVEIQL